MQADPTTDTKTITHPKKRIREGYHGGRGESGAQGHCWAVQRRGDEVSLGVTSGPAYGTPTEQYRFQAAYTPFIGFREALDWIDEEMEGEEAEWYRASVSRCYLQSLIGEIGLSFRALATELDVAHSYLSDRASGRRQVRRLDILALERLLEKN